MITHIFDCFPDAVVFISGVEKNADSILIVLCVAQAIIYFFNS